MELILFVFLIWVKGVSMKNITVLVEYFIKELDLKDTSKDKTKIKVTTYSF